MISPECAPIQRGQPVYLSVGDRANITWHAGLVTERDGAHIWVDVASGQPTELVVKPGGEIILETWRQTDARYSFRAEVVGVERGPWLSLHLRLVGGTRIQRREHFRVPIALTVTSALRVRSHGEPEPLELRLRDISAGGIQAASSRALMSGDELRFKLRLPNRTEALDVRARVVRVDETEENRRYPCEVGAAFIDLDTAVREQIIRFALQFQA